MRSRQLKIFRLMSRNTLCLMCYLSYKTKYRGKKTTALLIIYIDIGSVWIKLIVVETEN